MAESVKLLSAFYAHARSQLGLAGSVGSPRDLQQVLADWRQNQFDRRVWRSGFEGVDLSRETAVALTASRVITSLSEGLAALGWESYSNLIDFGSGDVTFGSFIAESGVAKKYVPIDRAPEQIPTLERLLLALSDIEPQSLIYARFVLHHLSYSDFFLLLEAASEYAIPLLIEEDLLSEAYLTDKSSCVTCDRFNTIWDGFSEAQRREALAANDLWSNCIVYGRPDDDQFHAYRTPEDLSAELRQFDLTPRLLSIRGFDHGRPHGVPLFTMLGMSNTIKTYKED